MAFNPDSNPGHNRLTSMNDLTITVTLPDDARRVMGLPKDQMATYLKMLLAIDLVREQKMSADQGATMAELSKPEFIELLTERGVAYLEEKTPEERETQIARARKSMLNR